MKELCNSFEESKRMHTLQSLRAGELEAEQDTQKTQIQRISKAQTDSYIAMQDFYIRYITVLESIQNRFSGDPIHDDAIERELKRLRDLVVPF